MTMNPEAAKEITQVFMLVERLKTIKDEEYVSEPDYHINSEAYAGDAFFWMAHLVDEKALEELFQRRHKQYLWENSEEDDEEPDEGLEDYDYNEAVVDLAKGFISREEDYTWGDSLWDELMYDAHDLEDRGKTIQQLEKFIERYLGPKTKAMIEYLLKGVESLKGGSAEAARRQTTQHTPLVEQSALSRLLVETPLPRPRPPRKTHDFNLLSDLGPDEGADIEF